MELKLSDTYVCTDNDPRPDMTISCFYTQLSPALVRDEIEYRGPKFLKRYIVKMDIGWGEEDLPWRPTVDYFSKAHCIAGNGFSIPMHLIRLRALALDTYGTNERAYEFLHRSHNYLQMLCGSEEVNKIITRVCCQIRDDDLSDLSVEDSNLFERIGGPEGARLISLGFPSLEMIRRNTTYDQDVQAAIDHELRERIYLNSVQQMAR